MSKIVWGQELPKEVWMEAAENLSQVAGLIATLLVSENYEGKGKQDADDFLIDMQLAVMAMQYVAEFAIDKCRILPL